MCSSQRLTPRRRGIFWPVSAGSWWVLCGRSFHACRCQLPAWWSPRKQPDPGHRNRPGNTKIIKLPLPNLKRVPTFLTSSKRSLRKPLSSSFSMVPLLSCVDIKMFYNFIMLKAWIPRFLSYLVYLHDRRARILFQYLPWSTLWRPVDIKL